MTEKLNASEARQGRSNLNMAIVVIVSVFLGFLAGAFLI